MEFQIPSTVTPALRALFDPDLPTVPRAHLVLDGTIAGTILCDDADHPTWAAVYEATYGTLYVGGLVEHALIGRLMTELRMQGDVVLSCLPDDPVLTMLPPNPDYDGEAIYFPRRQRDVDLDQLLQRVPADCELRLRDRNLFERSFDRDETLRALGSVEAVLASSYGVYVLRGDEILCEAATGPATIGRIEVGVTTHEGHRQRGYATLACARLIQVCEDAGYETWWDCAAQNAASRALAHRLGYRQGQEYRVLMWHSLDLKQVLDEW